MAILPQDLEKSSGVLLTSLGLTLSLHLVNLVNSRMGPHAMTRLHLRFDDYEDHDVLVVEADRTVSPIFVRDGNDEHFYIRTGPATSALSGSQTQDYIRERF